MAPACRCCRALDTVDLGELLRDIAGVACADERIEGRQRTGADARVLELLEADACRPGFRERIRARVPELNARGRDHKGDQHGGGRPGRSPAVTHNHPSPGRPGTAGAGIASVTRPVEPWPNRRQNDGEKRDSHRDADQRDQQPGDADAAQSGYRHDKERQQRDRHGRATEDDGGTGVLHRVPHRRLVRHVGPLPFLTPADDYEKCVVDRDAQPDQRDEELDDHRHVGDARDRPDQQERRRDRDNRHQQRHERHERTEDEDQDEERPQPRHQGPQQNPDAVTLGVPCRGAQRVEPRHLHRGAPYCHTGQRGLRLASLLLTGIDPTLGRDVDQGESRAAVVGHERAIAGRGIRRSHRARQRRLNPLQGRVKFRPDGGRVDRLPLRERHHRHDRRDVATGAVDRGELLVCLEALPSRHVELLRQSAARRPNRCERGNRDRYPETENESLVPEDPAG